MANSPITAKLVRHFELRFDPNIEPDEVAEHSLREEILADLEEVASIDHDRILRNQLGAIDATLRTSAYKEGRGATAFKLRSADVPAMPMPSPEFEIYVYAPEVEGIHLRGGKIARGGLRFSDRMDYRTEVYGLMRAQLTKNAIIVPAGAKGGFIVKKTPIDKAAIQESYVTYIRALLDVTDNLVDGEVVHPEGVRVRDEDDTYLVVAADKGTATFSDTANAVAREYGFWLDDAFASGGSVGYDHKKLGITARGAWESVKRHFRELGMDPARDEFTVVGIGDMSGDVFGNGMLLSDKLKLLAAYDHRHVFIDPDPDPATSFEERKRLFDKPGSSWEDYSKLSEGGGVYPRDAKWIELSDRAREMLGLEEARSAPNDVIRAILRAQVDLLWNGGIGTVVKASTETDADAADRSSDAIRVDARDLRCRVVGEGGNLGLTRRARVEFSAGGGLINADFIDNSAGVDCSDHEVNLKILLGLAERHGEMTRAGRDELLEAVTEDVVQHVLYDSFLQAQIIAQEVGRAPARMFAYEDLTNLLEEVGLLDRASEKLPSNDELTERRRSGRGLERPELATMLAYAKIWVARSIEASGFADDPWLERDLRSYFPARVVEHCGHLLAEHPLRTQLICMLNANSVVNALGPTFVSQVVMERGVEVASVVRAYRIAVEVTGADPLWDAIERLENVGRGEQLELLGGIDALVEATARWYLTWASGAPFEETIAGGSDGFGRLNAILPQLGTEERKRSREETVERLTREGVPEEVARAHALRAELVHGPDIVAVAASTDRSVEDVARVFFAIGAELKLDWMERELARVRSATRMQRWALQAVRDDAFKARRELAESRAAREARAPSRSSPSRASSTTTPARPPGSTTSSARSPARASPTSPASRSRCASWARSCPDRSGGQHEPLLVGLGGEEGHPQPVGGARRVHLGGEPVQPQLEVAAHALAPLLLERAGHALLDGDDREALDAAAGQAAGADRVGRVAGGGVLLDPGLVRLVRGARGLHRDQAAGVLRHQLRAGGLVAELDRRRGGVRGPGHHKDERDGRGQAAKYCVHCCLLWKRSLSPQRRRA